MQKKKSSMIFRKERYYFKLFMIKMCIIDNCEVIERTKLKLTKKRSIKLTVRTFFGFDG